MTFGSEIGSLPADRDEDRSLRVDYGYILAMMSNDEEQYYHGLIALERSSVPAGSESRVMAIEEGHEHLAASYGAPEDLIGRRVRIEYVGKHWWTGTVKIVPGRRTRPIGELMDVPSRGFRYAVAGGGSV